MEAGYQGRKIATIGYTIVTVIGCLLARTRGKVNGGRWVLREPLKFSHLLLLLSHACS